MTMVRVWARPTDDDTVMIQVNDDRIILVDVHNDGVEAEPDVVELPDWVELIPESCSDPAGHDTCYMRQSNDCGCFGD